MLFSLILMKRNCFCIKNLWMKNVNSLELSYEEFAAKWVQIELKRRWTSIDKKIGFKYLFNCISISAIKIRRIYICWRLQFHWKHTNKLIIKHIHFFRRSVKFYVRIISWSMHNSRWPWWSYCRLVLYFWSYHLLELVARIWKMKFYSRYTL